jgi:hypothetical protein
MQVRSEVQECAIIVALLMCGIIVERFIEVLKETLNGGGSNKSSGGDGAPVVILSEGDRRTTVDKYEIRNWQLTVSCTIIIISPLARNNLGVSR